MDDQLVRRRVAERAAQGQLHGLGAGIAAARAAEAPPEVVGRDLKRRRRSLLDLVRAVAIAFALNCGAVPVPTATLAESVPHQFGCVPPELAACHEVAVSVSDAPVFVGKVIIGAYVIEPALAAGKLVELHVIDWRAYPVYAASVPSDVSLGFAECSAL